MRLITQIHTNPKSVHVMKDTIAGIIIAMVSIPISMGYAQIAGLPAVYGLYGSLIPILIFAFLTTSPQFVVGVDAMPAVMVGGLLSQLGIVGESKDALALVPMVSLMVGFCFILFYFLKAGRVVKYISTPVMGGFISGVGLTIIFMQIPKLFGGAPGIGNLPELIGNIVVQSDNFNLLSFVLGFGTVLIIMVCKKIIPKVPMTVVMMIVGAILQLYFNLDKYGVKLLPEVERGLPKLVYPRISILSGHMSDILFEAFSIALVIMAQTLLASGNYAMKYGDELNANAELLAYSGMNLASGAFGCAPINGSVSRSGIADSFGCRSQIMSISSGLFMLLIILFGTPYLKYLPVPILTGIVMTALIGILEIDLFKRLWRINKNEWIIFMISLLGVLLFGTVNGVMIGCVLSFFEVAIRATNPPRSFIGRIPGHGNFYTLDRNSNARPIKGAVIYRFSGNLFFANIDRFEADIKDAIKDDTKCVIVDARGIGTVDITAVDRLIALSNYLQNKNIEFYITEHDGLLNDMLRRFGGGALVEQGQVRRTITLALRDIGFEKPYKLEASEEEISEINELDYISEDELVSVTKEPDERLAEMEWAFGQEAEQWIEKLAKEAAEKIVSGDDELDEHTLRVHTRWGTLGRFDENAFWDYLEMQLEELHHSGKLSDETLERLEKRIESRRIVGEDSLRKISPHALERLREHQKKLREHFKEARPEEYEHIHRLQMKLYEDLAKKNPHLADVLRKLHENEK